MERHLVIVGLSHRIQNFQFTNWQDADFIAQAAKKFGHKYVWWYRTDPQRPWTDRHRSGVSRKDLDDPSCPFGHAGREAALIAQAAPNGRSSSKPSGQPPSKETGPGLEKP